jgi:hypothetical protein
MELKGPKVSVLEISTPKPYLQNMNGSSVILQELSVSSLSGLHCLSLQERERCIQNSCNFNCSLLKDCRMF